MNLQLLYDIHINKSDWENVMSVRVENEIFWGDDRLEDAIEYLRERVK